MQEGTDLDGVDASGTVLLAAATTEAIPEVVKCNRMSGAIDYAVRVVMSDIAAYGPVHRRLIGDTYPFDVRSSLARPGSTRSA